MTETYNMCERQEHFNESNTAHHVGALLLT